jgi:hypothetical protein
LCFKCKNEKMYKTQFYIFEGLGKFRFLIHRYLKQLHFVLGIIIKITVPHIRYDVASYIPNNQLQDLEHPNITFYMQSLLHTD